MEPQTGGSDARRGLLLAALVAGGIAVLVVGALAFTRKSASPPTQLTALARNPTLDPGTPIHGVAPGFTLIDQFGGPSRCLRSTARS